MALNSSQLAALKAAILADPALAALPISTASAITIADAFNAPATPAQTAWRTELTALDLDEASDISAFDALSAGKRDAWALFLQYAPRDFSRNKNRKVVRDVWGNSTSNTTVAFSIYSAATRPVTRAEQLLGGTGTASEGSGTGTVTAKKLSWQGEVTSNEVEAARSL